MKTRAIIRNLTLALCIAVIAAARAPAQKTEKNAAGDKPINPVLSLLVPDEPVTAGATINVNLVALNPVDHNITFDAPATLQARLTGQAQPTGADANDGLIVTLQIDPKDDRGLDTIGARRFVSYTYELTIPATATGGQILALRDPAPVRVLLDVAEAGAAQAARPASSDSTDTAPPAISAPLDSLPPPPAVAKVKRTFLGNFTTYEPVYFIYGPDAPAAKFQFSFMYRMLDDEGRLARNFPALKGLSFAYTQRSLWDITDDSSPFYDTSYMPEIFCAYAPRAEKTKGGGFNWLGWQAGFAHESNGRDGPASRSMNKITARTLFAFGNLDGWRLILTPRVWGYIGDMSDNPDLNDYHGYMDLGVSLGKNDNLNLAVYLRAGQNFHYGAVQVDLTYPLDTVFKTFAGYLLIQYWNGYGESLLNYNQRTDTIRFGISLVR
ncbi:MAG: phospholipase A [Opitutaceae bacterium]|jgi:outer membrane phospholipase A|nr:phospholipase A [Opitutaceae bacterium]